MVEQIDSCNIDELVRKMHNSQDNYFNDKQKKIDKQFYNSLIF
jgi:hypothetical protein